MSSISSSFLRFHGCADCGESCPCPLDLHLPLVDASFLPPSLSVFLLAFFVAIACFVYDNVWGQALVLRPRKSDGLAATSIASGYTQAPKKKSSTSARVSSGSSGSGSEDDDLPDPATLLASVPSKSAKSKVRKRSVDAMDVDEEPAAPPNKKANRAGKGGSAVSNAAETPLKAKERPLPRPKFSGARSAGDATWILDARPSRRRLANPAAQSSLPPPSSPTRTIDLDKIELEEALRIDDSFDFEINRSSRRHIPHAKDAPRSAKRWIFLDAGFRPLADWGVASFEWRVASRLVTFYNTLHIILVTVRYRYGAIDPLEPLPSDPNHQSSSTRHLVMNKYDEAWADRVHREAEGLVFGMGGARAHLREKIPEVHKHQSQRILEYIGLRQKVLSDVEHRLNTLGCYILFRIRAQFEDEDRAWGAPSPPLPLSHRCCGAPAIAVLEAAPASDSDDEPLSASRDAKSKGKGKSSCSQTSSKKKAAERASLNAPLLTTPSRTRGGERWRGGDPITRSVKVKRGRKTVTIDLTGPRNRWHAATISCLRLATTASGNKIVTHGYRLTKNTLVFGDVEAPNNPREPSSARLLYAVRDACGVTWEERLYSPALGEEPPTGACAHCRADNASCSFADDLVPADAAFRDNAEYFELQQALMLDIAEESPPPGPRAPPWPRTPPTSLASVRGRPNGGAHAAYGGAFAARPDSRFEYKLSGAFTRGGDDEGSATEVDEKVETRRTQRCRPRASRVFRTRGLAFHERERSGPSTPPQPFLRLFSPAVPSRRSNTPDRARRLLPDSCVLYRRVLDARPDLFHLREARSVLGGNSSETSEESASVTFRWVKRTQRARSRARESSGRGAGAEGK
ncbi:hypothetical protein B0H13DRAFT_2367581 [Mycena leptocephala]|nr:hypothetical protein B0H13DRAFT_2367581 [Mycena leptocephala]